jgi:transposase
MFNVQGYSISDVSQEGNDIYLFMHSTEQSRCSRCRQELDNGYYDKKRRIIYIGSCHCRAVYGVVDIKRLSCPECGVLTEYQTLYEGKNHHSKQVGSLITSYSKYLDNVSISRLLSISPSKVYRIDRQELAKQIVHYKDSVPIINQACVDEVSFKRNHTYSTVLCNQEDSKVIWLEKNRKQESLEQIYNQFPQQLSHLKTVSMDFWQPYEAVTRSKFPKAKIVYDRFHLSRILNRHIEEERRAYQKELPDRDRVYIKKHTRWLLLRRKENQTESGLQRLQELRENNKFLYDMYLLKEDFLSIFNSDNSIEKAEKYILDWIAFVEKTSFTSLKSFCRKIMKRLDTILNWFDDPISNGLAEGINNVIKSVLKRGYGYKDFDYFRMKVLQRCGYLNYHPTHTF